MSWLLWRWHWIMSHSAELESRFSCDLSGSLGVYCFIWFSVASFVFIVAKSLLLESLPLSDVVEITQAYEGTDSAILQTLVFVKSSLKWHETNRWIAAMLHFVCFSHASQHPQYVLSAFLSCSVGLFLQNIRTGQQYFLVDWANLNGHTAAISLFFLWVPIMEESKFK